MDFNKLYQMVERSGDATSFNREDCLMLYDLALRVPKNGIIVEIGIEFGRSTTVLGVTAKERGLDFWAIDKWGQDNSKVAEAHVRKVLLKEFKLPIMILPMDSKDAVNKIPDGIDLLHIDGDHKYEGVKADILNYCPKLKPGGVVCFDDYGHPGLKQVKKAVRDFLDPDFKVYAFAGNKLGVFQKP